LTIDGLTLLDKPPGVTSFSALSPLKSKLATRRIGHTGTLDKFATGLLVVLIGRYTRLADLFSGLDKRYRATIIFGRSTDTLDPEGQTVEERPVPDVEAIRNALKELTGTIDQIPPVYSAVHVNGKRAYRIARAGGKPPVVPRRITVHRIDVLAYRSPELEVIVDCSKGTYIRALARDLGTLAGSCAYVQNLRRTRIGPYTVSEAVPPEGFGGEENLLLSREVLSRLDGIGVCTVRDEAVAGVRNGHPLQDHFFTAAPNKDGLYQLEDSKGSLIALANRDHGQYRYKMVL
jgi:tRNA pseudouridine55 synthase